MVSSNNDERNSSDSDSWKQSESTEQTPDDDSTSMLNFSLASEGRSLPNILKRISNIVALKSNVSIIILKIFLHYIIILYNIKFLAIKILYITL